ncbi:MAG: hypothetical protein PHW95_02120 [Patescibacteria group bacterium]|nr:hypothetical protein [Patescibacteria group bacterium]
MLVHLSLTVTQPCPNCQSDNGNRFCCNQCRKILCGHCFRVDLESDGSTGLCPSCGEHFCLRECQVCANCLKTINVKTFCPHCHGPVCHHCFISIIDGNGDTYQCPHCGKAAQVPNEWLV